MKPISLEKDARTWESKFYLNRKNINALPVG